MSETSIDTPPTDNATDAGKCRSCSALLPLLAAGPSEIAARWICVGCGTETSGFLDLTAQENIADNVRLAAISFDRSSLASPSNKLLQYVTDLQPNSSDFEERRHAGRRTLNQTIAVQPLDDQFRPQAEAFIAVTRDISRQGISLTHSAPITADMVALELTAADGKRVQIVMQVCRRSEVAGFHQVAGPMLMRMGADS